MGCEIRRHPDETEDVITAVNVQSLSALRPTGTEQPVPVPPNSESSPIESCQNPNRQHLGLVMRNANVIFL